MILAQKNANHSEKMCDFIKTVQLRNSHRVYECGDSYKVEQGFTGFTVNSKV